MCIWYMYKYIKIDIYIYNILNKLLKFPQSIRLEVKKKKEGNKVNSNSIGSVFWTHEFVEWM